MQTDQNDEDRNKYKKPQDMNHANKWLGYIRQVFGRQQTTKPDK